MHAPPAYAPLLSTCGRAGHAPAAHLACISELQKCPPALSTKRSSSFPLLPLPPNAATAQNIPRAVLLAIAHVLPQKKSGADGCTLSIPLPSGAWAWGTLQTAGGGLGSLFLADHCFFRTL
eukprot:gene12200-biopygen9470